MARYYGVINGGSGIQSAAAPSSAIAPDSLASLYGQNLASATAQAGSLPLPISLGGATLAVTASAGVQRNASLPRGDARGACPVQYERNRFRRGGRTSGGGPGWQRAGAGSGPCVSMRKHGLRLRAACSRRRSAGVRELLRHGNPQSQLTGERGSYYQWR